MTIAEIIQAGPKKSVHLTARVKRVFDGKAGVGARGQWTRQDFEVEDATGTLKVEWWGNDLGKQQLQGQTVTLSPGGDGKGCYLKEKEGTNGRPSSLVVSCDGPGRVTLAQGGLALTQASGTAQAGVSGAAAYAPPPAMAYDDYVATLNHIVSHCQLVLGLKDEAAIASIADTLLIAVTQGRVQGLKEDQPPSDSDDIPY